MKLLDVQKQLESNLIETSTIRTVELFGSIAKSPFIDDELKELRLTFDDNVQTQLRVMVADNRLIIELSQMEAPKPQPKVRVPYMDSNNPVEKNE